MVALVDDQVTLKNYFRSDERWVARTKSLRIRIASPSRQTCPASASAPVSEYPSPSVSRQRTLPRSAPTPGSALAARVPSTPLRLPSHTAAAYRRPTAAASRRALARRPPRSAHRTSWRTHRVAAVHQQVDTVLANTADFSRSGADDRRCGSSEGRERRRSGRPRP